MSTVYELYFSNMHLAISITYAELIKMIPQPQSLKNHFLFLCSKIFDLNDVLLYNNKLESYEHY